MTVDTRSLEGYIDTDARFRAWGSGVAAQILAMGLVKHTDTGQINWGSVSVPAGGAFGGYEIWRFDDVLQATKPVFIKVEYGRQGASNMCQLAVTVGTGTNGAGTLTGQVSSRRALTASNDPPAATPVPSYCSGSPSRLALFNNVRTNASNPMYFIVERPRDAEGDAQDSGIVFISGYGVATPIFQAIPFSGSVPSAYAGVPSPKMKAAAGQNSLGGNDTALFPMLIASNGKVGFSSHLIYNVSEITDLIQVSIDFLGATRNYLALGSLVAPTNGFHGLEADGRLAMLYE